MKACSEFSASPGLHSVLAIVMPSDLFIPSDIWKEFASVITVDSLFLAQAHILATAQDFPEEAAQASNTPPPATLLGPLSNEAMPAQLQFQERFRLVSLNVMPASLRTLAFSR